MKRIVLELLLILSTTNILMYSCCSDDTDEQENPSTSVGSVTSLSGTVQFDNSSNRWYIMVYETDTFDSINDYYPIQFNPDFMHIGLQVTFSGNLYPADFDIPVVGGLKVYLIELTSITKNRN